MKELLWLFCLLLPATATFAQEGAGTLQGKILTANNAPAPAVAVHIKDTKRSTVTEEDGTFTITNLRAGTYTLEISLMGFERQEQTVDVTAKGITTVSVQLKTSTTQLKEVVIPNALQKFAKKETEYVARMPLKNLENPQVYSVVNKELLKEQLAVDYIDAFRNAPGVIPGVDPTGNVSIFMRGFTTYPTLRNGLPANGGSYIASDPVNMERTEIIKGPSGTLFGASAVSFGGLINRVTKKPYDTFGGEFSYTTGSWNMNRFTADVNTPLNDDRTALLRVNAAVHDQTSFQDYGYFKSYTFAPSFTYKASDRLTFQFDIEMYGEKRTTMPYYILDPGVVTFRNFRDIPVNYTSSFMGNDLDAKNAATNFFVRADYKISDHWTSNTNYGFNKSLVSYSYQGYHIFVNDSTVNRTFSKYGPRNINTVQFQQNFIGQHTFVKFNNKLLVGFDVTGNNNQQQYADIDNYDVINILHAFAAPTLTKADALQSEPVSYRTKSTAVGGYVSDVITYNERLSLMLSGRIDHYKNFETKRSGTGIGDEFEQTAFSPKLGLVYQIIKDQVSVFGNYMNGFVNLGPTTQPDGTTLNLKPQQANQWEGGVKIDAFNHKLNATLSIYDIAVKNATRSDANFFTIQDGTQKSKGFEAEVITNPVQGLNVVLGYAYNENTYEKADAGLAGKYAAAAPLNVVNYWISYKLPISGLKNLGLGAGGNYVGSSYFDSNNVFVLPSYTIVNATIFYELSKWRLGIKANNLTNQKYWTANGTPMPLRQWIGNLTFKF